MSDEDLKKAQFLFDFVVKADRISEQSNERVLKKIHGVITLASTLIPVVFGLGYFVVTQTKERAIFIPMFASLIIFLLAITRGILLLKPKQFFYLDVLDLISKYKDESLPYIVNKSAVTWADIVNHNHSVINSREKGINQMLILIALGFIVLGAAFLTSFLLAK